MSNCMKKKYYSIIILAILFILLALSIELIFSKNFYINKNNRFLFSNKFSSFEIRQFIKFYSIYINGFFKNNNFAFSKIEEQNLYLIISKESFDDFQKDNLFLKAFILQLGKNKKYLKRIIDISKIENIEYRYIFGLNSVLINGKGSFSDKNSKIAEVNKNNNNDDNLFIENLYKYLILTYHQHLIYSNLSDELKTLFDIKSGIIPYKNEKYNEMVVEFNYLKFLINSIESFYRFILSNKNLVDNTDYHNFKLFISKDKTIKDKNLMITDDIIKKFIFLYDSKKNDSKKISYNSFDDFYVDLITENFELNEEIKIIVQNKFIVNIIREYGFVKFKKFIYILYNNKIDGITKIFEISFGLTFKDFLNTLF